MDLEARVIELKGAEQARLILANQKGIAGSAPQATIDALMGGYVRWKVPGQPKGQNEYWCCLACGHTFKDQGLRRPLAHKMAPRSEAGWLMYEPQQAMPENVKLRCAQMSHRQYRLKACLQLFSKAQLIQMAQASDELALEQCYCFGWDEEVGPDNTLGERAPKRFK